MDLVVQLIVAAAAGGVFAAIINAVVNRKKLSADATQIITQAAAGTVENIMKDNAALRLELGAVRSEIARLMVAVQAAEKRERMHGILEERYRWHLDRWHRYCARQTDEIRTLGGKIEDPPSMWPDLALVPADDD